MSIKEEEVMRRIQEGIHLQLAEYGITAVPRVEVSFSLESIGYRVRIWLTNSFGLSNRVADFVVSEEKPDLSRSTYTEIAEILACDAGFEIAEPL